MSKRLKLTVMMLISVVAIFAVLLVVMFLRDTGEDWTNRHEFVTCVDQEYRRHLRTSSGEVTAAAKEHWETVCKDKLKRCDRYRELERRDPTPWSEDWLEMMAKLEPC